MSGENEPNLEEWNSFLDRLANISLDESDKGVDQIMDANTVQGLLRAAIEQAVAQTSRDFQARVDTLTQRLAALETPVQVEEYKPIEVRPGVECNESLDIVKSLPEFKGEQEKYVSWRQSAVTAH